MVYIKIIMESAIYVTRAHKQHASTVVVVPRVVCDYLGLRPGDYCVFRIQADSRSVDLERFDLGGGDRDNVSRSGAKGDCSR